MTKDKENSLRSNIVYLTNNYLEVCSLNHKYIKLIKFFQILNTLNRERNEYSKIIENLQKENKKLKLENKTLKEDIDPYLHLNKLVNNQ